MAEVESKAKSWHSVESKLFTQYQMDKDINSLVVQFARNRNGHVESNERYRLAYELGIIERMGFPGYLRVIQPSGDCFLIQNQSKPSFNILSCTFDTLYTAHSFDWCGWADSIRVLLEFACATRSATYSHVFKPPKISNHWLCNLRGIEENITTSKLGFCASTHKMATVSWKIIKCNQHSTF